MKINAITSFRNGFSLSTKPKNTLNYSSQPSFEGIFDVFKKQPKEKSVAQKESDDINEILKSSIKGDKALEANGKVFLKQLNKLLKLGKEDDYKGYLYYTDAKQRKNIVTFGDIDENFGIPANVNIWRDGKLKTVYEIDSILPQSIYSISTYDDDRECFYRFINDKNLLFQSMDKEGIIVAQYPAENGFCQRVSTKVNDKEALFNYEIYWDYKHPENSYVLYNTDKDAIRFGYDKKQKFWYQKEIIPYDKKDETQIFQP